MSLLNDMLRDLAHHKPVADGAEGYDERLLEVSSYGQKRQQSWLSFAIFFAVIFCGVLLIKHFVFSSTSQSAQQLIAHDQSVVPANKKTEAGLDALVAPTKPQSASADQPRADVNASAQLTAATQDHINDLLAQAERALSMERLTSPVEDNAYNYYQKILNLNPNNSLAKDGLDIIAGRYMAKAQEQLNEGNVQPAQALIQRARFVSERYVQAHEIVVGESVGDNPGSAENIESEKFNGAASESKLARDNYRPETQSSETIKSVPIVEAQSLSVTPNAAWKDEQVVQQAQELIQQAKQAEAMALLKNFVAAGQKPALSAAALIDLYIQQGNTQAAAIVLQKATYLTGDVSAKLQAQLWVQQGDDSRAIGLLEKNLAAAQANESYQSLLASLYHKTANYQESIASYQNLLKNFGEKPAYWLGLALAFDGLAQSQRALQAYQRLRQFPELQEQVKKYTDQRIAAISGE